MRWQLLLLGAGLSGLLPVDPAGGEVRRVPAQYSTIQAAIDAASDGDRIEIGAGTYREPIRIRGRSLKVVGEGVGAVRLKPSPTLPRGAGGADGRVRSPALLTIEDGAAVVIDGLVLELDDFTVGIEVVGAPGQPGEFDPELFELTLSNGCLIGSGLPGSVGLLVDGTAGTVRVHLTRMIVENWDIGIRTLGPGAEVTANDNALTPNLTAAFDNSGSGAFQDARNNWWGSFSGPGGVGPGSGDAVLGTGVTFLPWRLSGTDTDVACGFNPPPDNIVTPDPPDSCLSTAFPCLTVPIRIERTDNAQMRGWSVTFQLSPELALCGGPGSISEGDYLTLANPATDFHVIDNGGGSYTVDDAILGVPCGQDEVTGTLFYVPVTHTGVSGTGTITVTAVLLRDCDNIPIDGSAGAVGTLDIDLVPTGPVTALAASQVLTGNDADGTTRVTLTWSTPSGAAAVEVYRAPFGNYPEYDDPPGPGSVPAAPAYPPGGPWTLTAVTASGQDDEVANRDVWYYVAFAVDSCGNVSAASSLTAGTLNYHLGDVHDGVTDCAGDNLVTTSDISFLGAHYGAALGPADPRGCLDIGPTLDFSPATRPTTDNLIDFEDHVVLALNYGLVSAPVVPGPVARGGGAPVNGSREGGAPSGRIPGALVDPASPAAGIHLRFDTTPAAIAPGDTFLVEVVVDPGDAQFNAFDLVLAYDPEWLDFIPTSPLSAQRGALMTGACANTFHQFSAEPGQLEATLSLLCNNVFVTGPGVIYRVKFAARDSVGMTTLSCAAGSQFFRAGFFVNPLDCQSKQLTVIGTSGVDPGRPRPVPALALDPPLPGSAASPVLRLGLSLPAADNARLELYDIQGRRLAARGPEALAAGRNTIHWPLEALPSGLYLVRVTTDGGLSARTRWLMVR
jgi:hypothetical protein